jgi:hypothetical protein
MLDPGTVGLLGVVAELLTHWLGQRVGEKHANQVHDELSARLDTLDSRVTEVKGDIVSRSSDLAVRVAEVNGPLTEVKIDLTAPINHLRTGARSQIQSSSLRVARELKAATAGIIAALAEKGVNAGGR